MKKLFKNFAQDESGATAIEYGLIAAGISVVIIAVVTSTGTGLLAKFTTISNALNGVTTTGGGGGGGSGSGS